MIRTPDSSGQQKETTDRLMSKILNNFAKRLMTPNVLVGMHRMKTVMKQKESEAKTYKQRATYDQHPASGKVPSVGSRRDAGTS